MLLIRNWARVDAEQDLTKGPKPEDMFMWQVCRLQKMKELPKSKWNVDSQRSQDNDDDKDNETRQEGDMKKEGRVKRGYETAASGHSSAQAS